MKKVFFLLTALCLTLSACMPAVFQTNAASPVPISETDLEATVAISVQQTLQSLPSPTLAPSNTAVILIETSTPPQVTPIPTGTQNPILLTLTAALGTGTVIAGTPGISTVIPNPAISATPTGTLHPQHYGTMPPNLPSGDITLINESRAEVYVSLQCTTKDGYVTIIEYPVGRRVTTSAPAGEYIYVVWVGGNKIVGEFVLGSSQNLTMTIYKDRVGIKTKQ
jgi:hypothetical protein